MKEHDKKTGTIWTDGDRWINQKKLLNGVDHLLW